MISISKFLNYNLFEKNTEDPINPAAKPDGKKRILVVNRIKKVSFPPQSDDSEVKVVRDISPESEVVKKDAIVRDPKTGDKIAIDEPPVIIRRKK